MFTAWDYVDGLVALEHRFSAVYMGEHMGVSHDRITDYLRKSNSRPGQLWAQTSGLIQDSPESCLVIDDSTLGKPYGPHIELASRQYSGAVHGLVHGINIVNLLHVNKQGDTSFPIDYAVYCPQTDGRTKNDIFRDLLAQALERGIQAKTVLFDAWYGSVENLKFVMSKGLIFYTKLKGNRLISLSPEDPYTAVSEYSWKDTNPQKGVLVKLKQLPTKVWLFKVVAANGDIDWIITNAPDHNHDPEHVQKKNGVRWGIEELHRELKQNALIDRCQARSGKAQRNHILCAYRAVTLLRYIAKIAGINPYKVKAVLRSRAIASLIREVSTSLRPHLA
jgi:hypothetical protein